MSKNGEPLDAADREAEIEKLVARFSRMSIAGVPLSAEPLWAERLHEIAAWLPDNVRHEMTSGLGRFPNGPASADLEEFADRHGLTPAETRLVESVALGLTVAEHAANRGISVNTARVHMQRVLEKTGARRQARLIRMLLA